MHERFPGVAHLGRAILDRSKHRSCVSKLQESHRNDELMLVDASRIAGGLSLMEIEVVHSTHDNLEVPDGFRTEIVEGRISITGPQVGRHAAIINRIERSAKVGLPPGHGLFQVTTAQEPGGDRYIPDLIAWPIALLHTSTEWVLPASKSPIAVEVTAPGQGQRDYRKASGYARAEVPTYLLVDRGKQECVVFTDPNDGWYQTVRHLPFGEPVELTIAKSAIIDTSDF